MPVLSAMLTVEVLRADAAREKRRRRRCSAPRRAAARVKSLSGVWGSPQASGAEARCSDAQRHALRQPRRRGSGRERSAS
jgi:hypothetical protein